MIRDDSQFLPSAAKKGGTRRRPSTLEALGWQPFFAQQVSMEEMDETPPARVTEIHRNGLHIVGDGVDATIPPRPDATVGDWLLLNRTHPPSSRVLERRSLVKRRAAGSGRQVQLIAANIDTAFIVTSCNQDFSVARLERYIALALDADVTPVIILTKSDLCEMPEQYVAAACEISDRVPVVVLDARGDEAKTKLAEWCRPGQTVVFLGSSGVGKSTLVNALSGTASVQTRAIREADAKGRHTTTHRQLYILPDGCAVLDTPGMRELQLTDAETGVADVFADLYELSTRCRFNDCRHETEPGCAVLQALQDGTIDAARLERWKKLAAEEQYNTASLAQRKSKDKALGKVIRQIQKPSTK